MAKSAKKKLASLPANIAGISYDEFNFWQYSMQFDIISQMAERGEEISDYVYSFIVNPPPIYASAKNNEMDRIIKQHTEQYIANKEKSLTIVSRVKQEFYDFFCTQKAYYKKQRDLLGGGINILLTGLSVAIAAKLPGIDKSIITALIAAFLIVLSKMTKKIFCEIIKPSSTPKPQKPKKK